MGLRSTESAAVGGRLGFSSTLMSTAHEAEPPFPSSTFTFTVYEPTATPAVEGTGPEGRWNSAGVAVGSDTVNVKVDDGKGGSASCAVDIKAEEEPNHPPTAALSVERSPILPGERTGVTCSGSDPDNDPLTYSYTTTGGQIVGSGSNVHVHDTGLQPGSDSEKCTLNDRRGGTPQ